MYKSFFYTKGKENTFHEFMFPGEGVFLTQENAQKVITEMKQYDESLIDNLLMSFTVNETKYKFDIRGLNPKSLVFEDSSEFLSALKDRMNSTGWMPISKKGYKDMPSWGTKET